MPERDVRERVLQEKEGTIRSVDVDGIERLYAFLPLSGYGRKRFLGVRNTNQLLRLLMQTKQ